MKESSFLSEFLMITDIKTILFLAVLIGTFFIIRLFEKKKVKFSTRTICYINWISTRNSYSVICRVTRRSI